MYKKCGFCVISKFCFWLHPNWKLHFTFYRDLNHKTRACRLHQHNMLTLRRQNKPTLVNYGFIILCFSHPRPSKDLKYKKRDLTSTLFKKYIFISLQDVYTRWYVWKNHSAKVCFSVYLKKIEFASKYHILN